MNFIDACAGIGGFHLGINQILSNANCVQAIEIDKNARKSYLANFPNISMSEDINNILNLPKHDLFCAGFPCQSFSLAGHKDGLKDDRGLIIFTIAELLTNYQPKYFILENVPNIQKTNKGKDFIKIKKLLIASGYNVYTEILGLHTHANIPQCRSRMFFVGIRKNIKQTFIFPQEIKLSKKIADILVDTQQNDIYYYNKSSQYYELLNKSIIDDSIYQLRRIYVRQNKTGVCPTLTANMGSGGHNVPIIRDRFGIRKLVPLECLRFQGFNDNFKIVVSNTHIYKQIGNSVSPILVSKIIKNLIGG